ncbi:MAG: family 10 glycosylhydrolase [Bacteroides sp.]|nr:family 10 glycosylhydrolase [Bacteroides sp.]
MPKRFTYGWMFMGIAFMMAACSHEDDNDGGETPPPSSVTLARKEIRGVWMATVWELDWPQSVYDREAQKKQYTDYLDTFVACHINTLFVQIRPTADAFYDSPYESWSKSITGVAGKDPGYDVLEFMIREVHERNLEFHAWINPYRIATKANASDSFSDLDPKIDPSLIKDYDLIRMYNPALPEVHQRIADIVKDIITTYDVDGIHFDDYFYPDPDSYTSLDDAAEYALYGAGYSTIEAFRRGNVDTVVKKVFDVIVKEKPQVVFSISPTANNDYNYNSLYADVTHWCKEGWVDVIIPQLYSATGTSASSFNMRVGWWAQYCYEAVPVAGYALYKFGDASAGTSFQSTNDLLAQLRLADAQPKIRGSVMYRAKNFHDNNLGIIDVLKREIYTSPAVRPFVGRKTMPDPSPVFDVEISGGKLKWDRDDNLRTVVYKVEDGQAHVTAITSDKEYMLMSKGSYCLTTVNKNNLESEVSEVILWN